MAAKVYLVGGGTGRFENLTLKALDLLETADCILYDRLVNPGLLSRAKPGAQLMDVGKVLGPQAMSQEAIHDLLLEACQVHETVVRLKSGDPYVFGRGGEEALALKDAGIDFEIVPGISSSMGGLSYAGIPLTYRGTSLDFHVYTGHSKDGLVDFDWQSLAKVQGTMVFLMGMQALGQICQGLLSGGKDPHTPVAVIQWASRAMQASQVGTLTDIEDKVAQAGLKPPCLIVVGQVVAFQNDLDFFTKKPLFGKRLAIPQSLSLESILRLEGLGAELAFYQTDSGIETALPQLSLSQNQLVFFTSQAWTWYLKAMKNEGISWLDYQDLSLIAFGDHVKAAMLACGLRPSLVLQDMKDLEVFKQTACFVGPESILGNLDLPQVLISQKEGPSRTGSDLGDLDGVLCLNQKGAKAWGAYASLYPDLAAFALGPKTSQQLREIGQKTIYLAKEARLASLIDTIQEVLSL